MKNFSVFSGIKDILKTKNGVRETKCGFVYKIAHVKKYYRKCSRFSEEDIETKYSVKSGKVYYFADFGNKCSFYTLNYSFNDNKPSSTEINRIWFIIKNGRLVILKKDFRKPYFLNISNCSYYLKFNSDIKILERRFKKLFFKWIKRNNIKIRNKYKKLNFFELLFSLCYPGLNYLIDSKFNLSIGSHISSFITRDLIKAKGLNHLLKLTFGTSGKQIKSILESTNANLDILVLGRVLKGLIPIDYFYKIFKSRKVKTAEHKNKIFFSDTFLYYLLKDTKGSRSLRFFLKQYHKDTILKWFINLSDADFTFLRDAAVQYFEYRDKITLPNSTNIIEIHDYISREVRRIGNIVRDEKLKKQFEKRLEQNKKIHNYSFGEYTIKVPETPADLRQWGEINSNCIYGYAKSYANGILLLGVYKNNNLLYNIEIIDNNIRQFSGKHNRNPLPEDAEVILSKLRELNILSDDNFEQCMERFGCGTNIASPAEVVENQLVAEIF